jgi:hypothetical protein
MILFKSARIKQLENEVALQRQFILAFLNFLNTDEEIKRLWEESLEKLALPS